LSLLSDAASCPEGLFAIVVVPPSGSNSLGGAPDALLSQDAATYQERVGYVGGQVAG